MFIGAALLFGAIMARANDAVVFTVEFPMPSNHIAVVTGVYPAAGQNAIELMMPRWTPGYYRVENYADQILDFTATDLSGRPLQVERVKTNRWRIATEKSSAVKVVYRLRCEGRSVTTDWVGADYAVLNGGATFPALVEKTSRPYEVRLKLPPSWTQSMTALKPGPRGKPHEYQAEDYDVLVDSPLLVGKLRVQETIVAGVPHIIATAGAHERWDLKQASSYFACIVREHHAFWGTLPFERYVMLDVFRPGGGGLEHRDSMLLTSAPGTSEVTSSWAEFVCHEYFHAFNVKRLRPVELSTIDYEQPPHTGGLWVSEGITTYYGELLTCRAGISASTNFLSFLSSSIKTLQNSPGRLVQSLEAASLDVWNTPTSGLARDVSTNTISYYIKGPIVAFLLDARIQQATEGRRRLDDVMRLAFQRYSEAKGFTAAEFRQAAEEVAGVSLADWFEQNVSSPGELDYAKALDWFGLRFVSTTGPQQWQVEIIPEASALQQARWKKLIAPTAP